MTQKTKAIILIAIIMLATIGFGTYFFKQNKSKSVAQPQKAQLAQIVQPQPPQPTPAPQNVSQTITTSTITGTVSAITKDSIEIKNGEIKTALPLTDKVIVLSVTGSKIEKKTIGDVKVGTKVSIMINNANTSIISIQMGKDAGSAI